MTLNSLAVIFSTKLIPFAYAVIGFGLLILIHELGHFVFCKIFNISTPTFSIGMGPKIFEKKIGQTNFRLSAIPIGGYVEIAGLAEVGQGEQEHSQLKGENSFADKYYWQKALVLLGGVICNLLFAYIVFSVLFFVGIPKKTAEITLTKNYETFVKGDKLLQVNHEELSKDPKILFEQLYKNLMNKEKAISFTVLRENSPVDIELTFDNETKKEDFSLAIEIKSTPIEGEFEKYGPIKAIGKGIEATNQWIAQMVFGIKYLITQKSLKGAGGPVMIISKTFETAQKGLIPLFIFLAIISLNLAILNILPIGALDGGQLLFITIEAIIRREIPEIIKLVINIASWVLLLGLMLYLTYKDILNIFINK